MNEWQLAISFIVLFAFVLLSFPTWINWWLERHDDEPLHRRRNWHD
jgi:hypothetical protein